MIVAQPAIRLFDLQLATAVSEEKELRRLAVDPFVPAIVRKKVIHTLLADSPAHVITKNLLGQRLGARLWGIGALLASMWAAYA